MQAGFEKVKTWECLYVHRKDQLFMSAYVDDYKMAGKATNIKPMWAKLVKAGLELDPPVPSAQNTYLGCSQRELEKDATLLSSKREMVQRLTSTSNLPKVEKIEELANPNAAPKAKSKRRKPKAKATPQSASTIHNASCDARTSNDGSTAKGGKVSFFAYEMFGHVQQTVERYCELAGVSVAKLKPVATPCIDDHMIPPEEFETKGDLAPVAARIVLKALYVARICRLDIMWAVNMLAREVTRWNQACDRRLLRLISYMHHTQEHSQVNMVGDPAHMCKIMYFSDASFAGDLRDSKSTSGGILVLAGPNTFVPISWLCKKQGAVSHSTSEAEIIALDAGARMEGLPALMLWDLIIEVFSPAQAKKMSNRPSQIPTKAPISNLFEIFGSIDYVPPSLPITYGAASLFLMEDNDAVIKMVVKQRSPKLRHVARTHRVDLDWLFDRISNDPGCFIKFVGTKEQIADILTKGSFTAEAWLTLLNSCQIYPSTKFKTLS